MVWLTLKKEIVKNTIKNTIKHTWYDWVISYIPKPIKNLYQF